MVKTTVAVPGPFGKRSIDLEVGAEILTSHGGLSLLAGFVEKLGLPKRLGERFGHLDGRDYSATAVLTLLLSSKLVGDDRLSDVARFQDDLAVRTILGLSRVPHPTTVSRFLERAGFEDLFGLQLLWAEILREKLLAGRESVVVDVDSTPLMQWGTQEGSAKGYCPKRHGARTYSPNLAFDARTGLPLHQTLRPGNRTSLGRRDEFLEFAEFLFSMVLAKVPRVIFRADSGYFAGYLLDWLEERDAQYVISARGELFPDLDPETIGWRRRSGKVSYGEFLYRKHGWSNARRFVIKRDHRREAQRRIDGLLDTDVVIVTNKAGAPKRILDFYDDRGTAEQYIAEGKQSFAFEKFPSRRFLVNRIDFALKIMAMGLLIAFRDEVLPAPLRKHRPGTIRDLFVNVAAKLVRTGRRLVLRFTKAVRRTEVWAVIFHRLGRAPPAAAW